MATRYKKSNSTADEGVDFSSFVCSRSGRALFLERPRQDVGIDAHIEFLNEQYEPSGAFAFVQCKAGLSYISPAGKYQIKADKDHFETWSRYDYPVIGIVYNPEKEDARWVNISEYLRNNPTTIQSGPYNIEAPENHSFSKEGFPQFQETIEAFCSRVGKKSAQSLIDAYLLSRNDDVAKDEYLTELMALHRWTPTVCFFIHNLIKLETDPHLLAYLITFISFYRPHPNRWYSDDNTCPENLKPLAQVFISTFDTWDVLKLLSTVDEEHRDPEGYQLTLALQFLSVPEIRKKLCEIARNSKIDTTLRGYAISIFVEYLNFTDQEFLVQLLRTNQNNFVGEVIHWSLDYLFEVEGERDLTKEEEEVFEQLQELEWRKQALELGYMQKEFDW